MGAVGGAAAMAAQPEAILVDVVEGGDERVDVPFSRAHFRRLATRSSAPFSLFVVFCCCDVCVGSPVSARDSAKLLRCDDAVSSHARRLVAHRAVVARRRLLERVAAAALPAVDGPHAAFLARATAAAGAHAAGPSR